jgi:hypothetical protein
MGKKTVGKKGYESKKDIRNEADISEVSVSKNALQIEQGVKLSREDERKKEERRAKKKKHKEEKSKDGIETVSVTSEILKDNKVDELVKGQDCFGERDNDERKDRKEADKKKEKKKRKRDMEGGDVLLKNNVGKEKELSDGKSMEKDEPTKKKEKKKRKRDMEGGDVLVKNNVGKEKELSDGKSMEKDEPTKKKEKKKRKRDMEGGDVLVKNNVGKEKELSDGKSMEKDEPTKKEKKKKRKRDMEGGDVLVKNNVGKEKELSDGKSMEKVEPTKKKGRKESKNYNDDLETGLPETIAEKPREKSNGTEVDEFADNGCNAHSSSNETGKRNTHAVSTEDGNEDMKKKKKKKKKVKLNKLVSEGNCDGAPRTKKDVETSDLNQNSTLRGTSKRVSFSDHVEVFTSSDAPIEGKSDQDDSLVRGKRFSLEEDEMVKKAVLDYIEAHDLGDEGLNMVLHCRDYPEVKKCWKEIGAALPWRPSESVYYRAHILFERSDLRKWTEEEYELIRSVHAKHGPEWKMLADALGKHRFHVKDTWRRIKLSNMKKGRWSQDEYQTLFDLVNMDLRMKASEQKKSKHGMLRDNIAWEAISDKLSTRTNVICCLKWYNQLTSPMVSKGIWADVDDYRLMDALYNLDACCIEDVDWDNLVENRTGDVCRQRWDQMVKHIGDYANKSFAEQVEVLSQRYCTDVLEAREAYDSKPAI